MSRLFKSSAPKPPPPDPELVAAQERQRERLEEEEARAMRDLQARRRARVTGGSRMLLSMDRPTPMTGLGPKPKA